jgi:preprotein translocase subunit SecA
MIREDHPDLVYASKDAKYNAVANLIKELHAKGQPVLVGTISIESSERLGALLKKLGVPHEVLNAKQHEREATIVANAGTKGAVTIATNMAGRGTDIKLTAETKAVGGLYIIGTERHESRRIDNQLRGRSGRQGDPGQSKFFLSLEDDLMRIFGSDKIKNLMMKLGMKEDEPIEHNMISNAIAKAQKKVEQHNFDIRKHLLDFDNVMHEQRKVIYKIRRDILNNDMNEELVQEFLEDVCHFLEDQYKPDGKVAIDNWGWDEINTGFHNIFHADKKLTALECSTKYNAELYNYLHTEAKAILEHKFKAYDPRQVTMAITEILLSTFDSFWKDHLLNMDHLKEGINLRSYGQKDPLVEYKREAFAMYEAMKGNIKRAVIETLYGIELYTQEQIEEIKRAQAKALEEQLEQHRRVQEEAARAQEAQAKKQPLQRQAMKVGRNDPCPCGSGKKFKSCHGA